MDPLVWFQSFHQMAAGIYCHSEESISELHAEQEQDHPQTVTKLEAHTHCHHHNCLIISPNEKQAINQKCTKVMWSLMSHGVIMKPKKR